MKRLPLLILLALACGGAQRPGPVELTPDALYPMSAGSVWSYNVDTGEEPDALAISRVISVRGNVVEIRNDGGTSQSFERRPEGIFQRGPDRWLLRAPIMVGARWDGRGGGVVEITSTTEEVESPAGIFVGCVRVEERGGDDNREITTVYCPGVGPVLLEVTMTAELTGMQAAVRATLLAFALGEDAADLVAE